MSITRFQTMRQFAHMMCASTGVGAQPLLKTHLPHDYQYCAWQRRDHVVMICLASHYKHIEAS